MSALRRLHSKLTLVAMLGCVGAVALAGCGGSGSSASQSAASSAGGQDQVAAASSSPQKAEGTPSLSSSDVGKASPQHKSSASAASGPAAASTPAVPRSGHAPHGRDVVGRAGQTQRATHSPASADDQSTVNPHLLNPCTLVSVPEARSFTGGGIAGQIEAPLGPTCVFKPSKGGTQITLAVETMNAVQLTKHLGRRQELTVGGRRAYCGHLGTQLLLVPLSSRQTLSVSAPCAVARQFAARALSRLAA